MDSNRDTPAEAVVPTFTPAELIVETGRLSGTRRALPAPLSLVGRAAHCDVRLNVTGVAPLHCVVLQGQEGLTLRDLGSGKPTLVNGEAATLTALKHDDTLTVGPFQFRVSLPAAKSPQTGGRDDLEQERQALRTQAAAVVAQQAALTEEEARLEQRRAGLERQEQQLARHLEDRRKRLVDLKEEVRLGRETLHKERAAFAEEQQKIQGDLEQARQQAQDEMQQLERARKKMATLRDRLQRRTDRDLKGERDALRRRESELTSERHKLAAEVKRLEQARTTLEQARRETNGELELGRRALQDGWQQLHQERKQLHERLEQDKVGLSQQERALREREEALTGLEAELHEQQSQWAEARERLEQESEGLDSRARNYRRKVYELEQELKRLEAQRQAVVAPSSPAQVQEETRVAGPTAAPPVAAEALVPAGELAALELQAADLADQRRQLVEQCERFLVIQTQWQTERSDILRELDAVQHQIREREQALAAREQSAEAGDQVVGRHRFATEQARLRLEGMLSRQTAREVTFQAERDRLRTEVQAREEMLDRHQEFLLALRDRWAARRRGDMRKVREELELTRGLRLRYAALWEECQRRRVALDHEQRTAAEQALALEQLRLVLLGQSEDSAAADKRLEKMRRRCHELTASVERQLTRARQEIDAEAARTKEQAEQIATRAAELTGREEELSDQRADWEKEQALTELGRMRLQHELRSVKGQRDHYERQVVRLDDELERVARLLIDGGDATPLPLAA